MNMRDCHFDHRVIADESYFVKMYFADGARRRITDGDLDTPELAADFALAYMQEHDHAEYAEVLCFIHYQDGSSDIRPTPLCQLSRADLAQEEAPSPH